MVTFVKPTVGSSSDTWGGTLNGDIDILNALFPTPGQMVLVEGTSSTSIRLGVGGSGNRSALLDLIGDDTYTGYGCRLVRFATGANAVSRLDHRGIGALEIQTMDAAQISLNTDSVERVRISATGTVFFPFIGTTASAANAFLNSGSSPANQLLRSTSSKRYKKNITSVIARESAAILNLRPIVYQSIAEADDPEQQFFGLIAEEVAEVEPRLVQFNADAEGKKIPESVMYERLTVLLLDFVKQLSARVSILEAQ